MNLFGENKDFFVNDVVYGEGGTFGPRLQRSLQLVYIFRGSCRVEVDGEPLELAAGEATLLLPGRREYFRFAHDTCHGWSEVRNAKLSPEAFRFHNGLPKVVAMSERLKSLHSLAMASAVSLLPAEQTLRWSLAESILTCFLADAGASPEDHAPLPGAVARAEAFIHEHFAGAVDLDALARASAVSGPHLIRLYKEYLGTTPIRRLWEVRVRAGVDLLRGTGLGVTEIAYRCGFQTPYHFSRVIKESCGQSPLALRRVAWGRSAGVD